ncbi:MAG: cytochrome c biogenesis protein CcsA [Deltaproteobacteria bacterium]|nr:cytochrome c biogenesis protein CcsA [Deltaproteobacteria bacterium]
MLILFIFAALAYGAATFAYGSRTVDAEDSGDTGPARYARLLLAVASALHFFAIGAQCVEGDHPLKNIYLATSFGTLIAVGGYLALARRGKGLDALGPVLAPVGLIGLALGVVFSDVTGAAGGVPGGKDVGSAHVGFAAAGLAGFTLAAGVAGLYLGMERRLRRKLFRPGRGGLSLQGLDRLHHRLVLLVTPVFTLAIVTGVLWTVEAGGLEQLRGRIFEVAAAGIAWAASVILLVSRAVWGTRGRRSAWLTLIAFVATVLIVVSYGVRS